MHLELNTPRLPGDNNRFFPDARVIIKGVERRVALLIYERRRARGNLDFAL